MKTKNKILLFFLLFQFLFKALSVMSQQPQWTVYTSANSQIAGNWVLCLAEEQDGTKWIGTLSGLSKFNGSTWTNYYTTNSGLVRNHIHEITIDNQNNKWFSVPFVKTPYTMGGIHKFDGTTWTVYTRNNAPLINEKYQGIEFDSQGNLWIGMGRYISGPGGTMVEGGATVKLASGGWNVYKTSNSGIAWNDIYCFASDTGGTMWLGNFGGIAHSGLLKFYNNTWTVYGTDNSGLPEQNVMDIEIDGNNVWVATTFGIGKFDRLSNQWTVYRENNSPLPSSITECVVVDQIGAVWMGTLYGLARLYNGNWNIYTTSNSPLPHNFIEKIMVAADGKKWIATRGGLVVYDDSYLVGVSNHLTNTSTSFLLHQNYPNPFNPTTAIKFHLNNSGDVTLKIYDMTGKEIKNLISTEMTAGQYEYNFNAVGLSSGIYYYKLSNGIQSEVRKMILLR